MSRFQLGESLAIPLPHNMNVLCLTLFNALQESTQRFCWRSCCQTKGDHFGRTVHAYIVLCCGCDCPYSLSVPFFVPTPHCRCFGCLSDERRSIFLELQVIRILVSLAHLNKRYLVLYTQGAIHIYIYICHPCSERGVVLCCSPVPFCCLATFCNDIPKEQTRSTRRKLLEDQLHFQVARWLCQKMFGKTGELQLSATRGLSLFSTKDKKRTSKDN